MEEHVLRGGGYTRGVTRFAPYWFAIVGTCSVFAFLSILYTAIAGEEGLAWWFVAAYVAICAPVIWLIARVWRTFLLHVASEVRYADNGDVVLKTALRPRVVQAAAIQRLSRQALYPIPGVYRIQHADGVEYVSASREWREFVSFVRERTPDLQVEE